MKKGIKLVAVAAALLAAGAVAFAEIDLFDMQKAMALGKKTITAPAEATDWDLPAIVDCIKEGSGIKLDLSGTKIKTIGDEAFKGCNALKAIVLPKGATSIGDFAFYKCVNLTQVAIPNSVMSIGVGAFRGCSSLKRVAIPNSVTDIGFLAFCECSALEQITIPSSVTCISYATFNGCVSLKQVTIPNSVTSIGVSAFGGCKGLADKDGFVIVRGILFDYIGDARSIVIPEGVTRIDGAFYGCKALTQVKIPSSVTDIGDMAFYECSSLTSIVIPASVTRIWSGAFDGCTALKKVTFANTSGWYFDDGFTQRAKKGDLASSLKNGKALYKKAAARSANRGKVELTVWESRSGPDEFIKQAGAKYHETHPNVTIKFVNVELGDAAGQIALDGPAGFGADLFAAPHDKLGELVNGGHVAPTVNPTEVANSVLGACVTALTATDGKMYGYPVSAETYALFYNREFISDDEVPTTWEDLKDWVIEFNGSHPGKRGFVMDVGNAYYSIIFTTANGNRLFGKSGDDTFSTYLNTPDAVAGMKFFQSLRSALNVPAENLMTGNCDGAFQGGTAAMHITGIWNIASFEYAGLDFGVAPLPALPRESTPAASFSGTRAMFVSAYTDYPDEAADFARFLISEDMQKLRFDITGATPSIQVEVSSPYIGGFLEQLEYAFPLPSAPQMGEFWMAFGSASANIWDGSSVQRELDACDRTILGR